MPEVQPVLKLVKVWVNKKTKQILFLFNLPQWHSYFVFNVELVVVGAKIFYNKLKLKY